MMTSSALVWLIIFGFRGNWVFARPEPLDDSIEEGSGNWSGWTTWTKCTKHLICNSGTRQRRRFCKDNKNDTMGGDDILCLGPYDEQEDCPKTRCTDSKPLVYQDVTEAPLSSFISQECDTDAKFAVASEHGKIIPSAALIYCKNYLSNFLNGYFNIKRLPAISNSKIGNVTKICFEPRGLSVGDVAKISRFNRVVRATLNSDGKRMHQSDMVSGVAIVLNDSNENLQAVYFAVPSSKLGYKKVAYRRWRGVGVLETL